MDWLLTKPQITSIFASLGSMQGDIYVVSKDCLATLDEINCKLSFEDHSLRTFRREIGFGQNVKNDLIPLLINTKDCVILDAIVRILVNLTVPVECLLSVEIMSQTETGRITIFELNKLLYSSKEAFNELKSTKAVVDYMKNILEKKTKLSIEQCDCVNNCLLLLRNILHIPEVTIFCRTSSIMQNQIIWNLFTQSIDKWLIYLMSCTQRAYWGATMVQLIALMYKDQHIGILQRLLTVWFEGSESSDNESNTCPPSPMITSDPTSDSSDNGGNRMITSSNNEFKTPKTKDSNCNLKKSIGFNQGQKRRPSSQSELSDCGYGTQVENQESISTSSNDDDSPQVKPIHHPPCNQKQRYNAANKQRNNCLTIQDNKDWRKKKLVKRSRSTLTNMKGLIHHTPTDEDISNILKEFTVDFLLKGYDSLVQELHAHLLPDSKIQIDTSHFFWLVTYFLKFAAQLQLDLEHISSVLSYDIISYLTYEGVTLCEQIELGSREDGTDIKPYLRRIHLVITAIREFLQTITTYNKITNLSLADKEHLKLLQTQIAATEDLKCLFVLLIRKYNSAMQSKQYLQDLVVTNHMLLLLIDSVDKLQENEDNKKIVEHLKQFATAEIMQQYGILLEDFKENGEYVNDCIFTMMHHTGGDLGQIATLYQPVILKTFSKIWELEYELCDDWSDLIEYVIHKFINTPQKPSLNFNITESDLPQLKQEESSINEIWTEEEMNILYWYYVQSKNCKDIVGNILKHFCENGIYKNSRILVIQQLLSQDIINLIEYDELMSFEDKQFVKTVKAPAASNSTIESGIEIKDSKYNSQSSDDVQILIDRLMSENKGHLLIWLQKKLLECCYAKLNANLPKSEINKIYVVEPVAYHCIIKKQSIPIATCNSEQNNILQYQPFVLLLHKLEFHLPADSGKLFIRIPVVWTADILYMIARQLGPIDIDSLKLNENISNIFEKSSGLDTQTRQIPSNRSQQSNSNTGYTPDPTLTTSAPNWLELVAKCKSSSNESSRDVIKQEINQPISFQANLLKIVEEEKSFEICMNLKAFNTALDEHEIASNCETASVASNLTRMYVSDEEDKSLDD